MKPKKLKKNGKTGTFDPQAFLDTAGVARKIAEFRRGESIYSQGEAAESVMYVQKGGVKFSVVNGSGKEAVRASRSGWARLQRLHRPPFWSSKKTSCGACSTPSMSYPTISSRICSRTTSESKR